MSKITTYNNEILVNNTRILTENNIQDIIDSNLSFLKGDTGPAGPAGPKGEKGESGSGLSQNLIEILTGGGSIDPDIQTSVINGSNYTLGTASQNGFIKYLMNNNEYRFINLGTGISTTEPSTLSVHALALDGTGNVYVGGDFNRAGGTGANEIAKWNPTTSTWSALGSGLRFSNTSVNSWIRAIAIDGTGNVYAGGRFDRAGGNPANRIARWNGSSWTALGSGLSGGFSVYALALYGNNLYVGGDFTNAGGITVKGIAKWDISTNSWNVLGSGLSGVTSTITVNDLVVDNNGILYAGGNFTTAGGKSANRIAKWDGNEWTALGDGFNSDVFALTLDGNGNLYAGGDFTTAGIKSTNRIAKWDGNEWSALGSGLTSQTTTSSVNALTIDGYGNLYAGGRFTTAGNVNANCIAKWDGSNWSALGNGVSMNPLTNTRVLALMVDGDNNLYIGGIFTTAGGVNANYIAKWDLRCTIEGELQYSGNNYSSLELLRTGQSIELINIDSKWNLMSVIKDNVLNYDFTLQ